MGTQRVQMKGVLPWLVRLAWFACTRDILFCLGCSSRPSKKYFFPLRTQQDLTSFVPIAHQAGQAVVLGRLSLSMCLWVNSLCGRNTTHTAASFRNYKDKSNLLLQDMLTTM
jgi:hypothetical protein